MKHGGNKNKCKNMDSGLPLKSLFCLVDAFPFFVSFPKRGLCCVGAVSVIVGRGGLSLVRIGKSSSSSSSLASSGSEDELESTKSSSRTSIDLRGFGGSNFLGSTSESTSESSFILFSGSKGEIGEETGSATCSIGFSGGFCGDGCGALGCACLAGFYSIRKKVKI